VRKFFLITAFTLICFSTASAEVFYEIDANKSSVNMNTTLELECDETSDNCPVNRWNLNWNIPQDAEVITIEDSYGEIEEYSVRNDYVSIKTNSGERRTSETVKIQMKLDRKAEHIHKGLYKRNINLAGFKDDETTGYLHNPDLISGWTGRGFLASYGKSNMTFKGTGSTSIRVNFGNGNRTEYYEFFRGSPKDTELAYEVSVGMTGLVQDFERFPVALMNPDNYEESVVGWSAGEYVAGSFRMRDDLEDQFLPVLAHETVHGLNERELKWDQTTSTWLDEGTSRYVESMVNMHLKGKDRTRKLFGEETTYTETRNGTRYRITAPSSGDPDRLWSYYQGEDDFMKKWNPHDFPEERSFGYAYSELIIRNHVAREDGSLRELYRKLNPSGKVDSNQEKWDLMSQYLDLTPCKYESREKFDECLKQINEYDYEVYRAENITKDSNAIKLTPLEVEKKPNKKYENILRGGNINNSIKHNYSSIRYQKVLENLSNTILNLIEHFKQFIGGLNR